ncbi:hypothetical protein F5X99DRAFT_388409 [Biscogniauxia marginata]|nr:hypothetical protein F5X99DRAFT_388409 [Biscogniauxia marginata]
MTDVAPDGTIYMAKVPPGYTRHSGLSLQPSLTASGATLTGIALISVILRITTRTVVIRNSLYFDDLLVVIAMVMSIAMFASNFLLQDSGVGIHFWDVKLKQYNPWLGVWTVVTTCLYCLAITFAKLSILALYLRLSPVRWFRIGVWTLFGLVSSYSISYILAFIFRCKPVEAGWDVTIQALPTTKCANMLTIMMVLSIANICMDIIILLLPIPVVIPLQMRNAQKVSLVLLFGTGAFVCAVSIKRTLQMIDVLGGIPEDYTWDIVEQFHWSYLEVDLGIVCASVPALKPLVSKYVGPFFGSTFGRSSQDPSSKASEPYSTAIRRNKQRREAQGYELQSRDDKFEKEASRKSSGDDELRLWPKNAPDSYNSHHATAVASKSGENVSGSGSDFITQTAASNISPLRGLRGVKIKKETLVEYNVRS